MPSVPRPMHVVLVIEENHSFGQIIGSRSAPYINALARQGALMTNSFAVEHPSQPNYLDLLSGGNQGVTDDSCGHTFAAPNLGAELTAAGFTFGGFSESLPAAGFAGCRQGPLYASRHNPWADFPSAPAQDNLGFRARLRPQGGRKGSAGVFPPNFNALPTVSIVVPNLRHDMHDGTVRQGDRWLKANLAGYVRWARSHNSLFVLTWDEDDGTQANHIPTIVVGQGVKPGAYGEPIDHFNVLRTVEEMYGLPPAGASATAAAITDIWTTPG